MFGYTEMDILYAIDTEMAYLDTLERYAWEEDDCNG